MDLFEGLRSTRRHADAPATTLDHPTTRLHDDIYGTGPGADISISHAYTLDVIEAPAVTVARVLTTNGEIASIGRVAFVGDFAIYDRIETHNAHRRRKLASAVMNRLQSVALARGRTRGVLVATADGLTLYEALGWHLHSPYTTAVIPDPALMVSENHS
jgi:GNAT superfamily N-acetyltransferase